MNNNFKFRAIPNLTDFKLSYKLDEKSLLTRLIALTHSDSEEACTETLNLLQTLNTSSLSHKERVACLKLVDEYLKEYIKNLPGSCWEASFPLSATENLYAERVVWNYLLLGEGFFIAADTANKKNDAVLSLAMALEALGQAQLHIAVTYSIPNDGFWLLLYQVFAWAEKRKLQDLVIETGALKGQTINTLFARSLIFQICDTNQFEAKETRTIFSFLPKVCVDLPISLYVDDDRGLFMLDLKSDTPPCNIKFQTELGSDLVHYFSPVIIADALNNVIKQGDAWNGTLKSINNALFGRVANTLDLKQKRQYQRKSESSTLLGVIGFDDILGFLYKATKNTLDKPRTVKNNDDSFNQDLSATQKQIWEQNRSNINRPIKKVSLRQIKIFDSSANGYSVSWDQIVVKAKVGDLFGIISEDRTRLEIAIIRRLALSSSDTANGEVKFGAEVLGFESEIVYLSDMDHTVGIWAVFIPGIELLEQPDTLIYSMGQFKTGEAIYIHRGNTSIVTLLLKELHSTVSIAYVELAYPKAD